MMLNGEERVGGAADEYIRVGRKRGESAGERRGAAESTAKGHIAQASPEENVRNGIHAVAGKRRTRAKQCRACGTRWCDRTTQFEVEPDVPNGLVAEAVRLSLPARNAHAFRYVLQQARWGHRASP